MWLNLFYYLQGLRGTGPYVRTIIEVSKDMLGFMVLYVSILAGFSHAFFVVSSAGSGSATVAEAMLEMGQILLMTYRLGTLGDFEADEFEAVGVVIFFVCTFVITIMFLNVRRLHLNSIPVAAITRDPQRNFDCVCNLRIFFILHQQFMGTL